MQERMIRQVLAQKHSQEKEPTQSLLNTIASKDDPEYDVSFGDFNDFLPKTNALKPLAFSYGDTRRNAFRRANME
ncbi:hypothetical protein ID0213_08800 [Helicobacter pylori]